MPRFAFALAALLLASAPARAAWTVTETPGEADGTTLAAEAFSDSGAARLEVGCTPEDMLYVGIEYAGHITVADRLRVAYRVDGRGSIQGRWPTAPAAGALRVYNTTRVYVAEVIRRLRHGHRVTVDIELLPRLTFDLDGSDESITRIMQRCGGEEPPPEAEPADGEEGEAGPEADGAETADAETADAETAEAPDGVGAPTPLVPSDQP